MRLIRKHALFVFGGAALCLLVIAPLAGCGRTDSSEHVSAVPAAVAVAQRTAIGNSFSVAGEFVPYQEIEMHAKVSGYVRKIYVDIGDRVKAGQVLAVLEVPELMAQLQGTGAGVRHSQQEVQRMQNEVTRDGAQYAALHANAQRLEDASRARPGLIAQQELDDAEAKDRAAAAQVESAKSALSAARQQLEMSQASNPQCVVH